jgi:hypothetical protein
MNLYNVRHKNIRFDAKPVSFDGRNILDRSQMESIGFVYQLYSSAMESIGHKENGWW